MHLVVLCGYQGADRDQLLDAALGVWLHVNNCAWLLATSTWSPPRSLAWQKGSRLGSGLILEAAWAFASGRQPGGTCKRFWDSVGGSRREFMVGGPRAAAAVSGSMVLEDR